MSRVLLLVLVLVLLLVGVGSWELGIEPGSGLAVGQLLLGALASVLVLVSRLYVG